MLNIRNLSLNYGPIRALNESNIDVAAGEVVSIIGGNGAGKSTLLKGIAGLISPSTGSISFEGRDISKLPPHQRVGLGIALSPEGRMVFGDQSVRDNIALGAYSSKMSSAELQRAIDAQYELFPRLRERKDQQSGTLSGGEQQMLAIARALVSSPKLLLLDEPSLGLAPRIITEIFAILRELRSRKMTILLVEQMANQALALADRGYVLECGQVTLTGSGADLAKDPAVRAAYLGGGH